ncbi:MAG TPA: hypothetical protein VFS08_15370 [Gemmatimonadaceae bacterium]|nr:hypothetical protein [Gemmatimonadaceae bacterium]
MAKSDERRSVNDPADQHTHGASGKHGEPHLDVPRGQSMMGGLHEAGPGTPDVPESEVEPLTTREGSDSGAWGSEAAGGSVIDKRSPDSQRHGEQRGDAERLGERLRDADTRR